MNQRLHEALKEHFGFDTFKGNQEAIMTSLLEGNDVFVLMPTGGGKSLCYQLPALMMEGTAIVISPLIALMKNQVDAMRNFSSADTVAHFLVADQRREHRISEDCADFILRSRRGTLHFRMGSRLPPGISPHPPDHQRDQRPPDDRTDCHRNPKGSA